MAVFAQPQNHEPHTVTSGVTRACKGGYSMDFVAVVDQVIALLRQRGRVAYRTLKRQFQLDDEALEDVEDRTHRRPACGDR